ncbi:MAG: hypothetical protein NT060_03110 [Candidatus Omnitrophica bacterium]|nr:hypothetical protein [Candidatus Omnitrophota bacterium]
MKSFTLIELLFVSIIFTLLIIGVFQVMDVGRGAWFTGDTSIELRQEIIKTFMRMERELKETRPAQVSLGSSTSDTSLTFKIPQDIDGDGTILDSSGNIEWSPNIVYALNGSKQITRTASGATTIIANDVTSLLFTRPATPVNILQIDVTANKTTATNKILQDSGEISVKMRN